MSAASITDLLNATLHAIAGVVKSEIKPGKPSVVAAPIHQKQIGVLVGITGHMSGRLVIMSAQPIFSGISEVIFGMKLEGEMLHSFSGEFGNMVAGNAATNVAEKGVVIDITPPTVMVGDVNLYGFNRAFHIPVVIELLGEIVVLLILDEEKKSQTA